MSSSTTSVPSTKRAQSSTSSVPSAVKPTCKIHSLAIVADRAQLIGPGSIAIDSGTILHPYAKLSAAPASLSVGAQCMIAEKAVVGSAVEGSDCTLAEGVSVESAAIVEAKRVGEWSTICVGAKIGKGAVIGKWCKVGPLCEIPEGEVLEDYTVVYGYGERRVDAVLRDQEDVREVRAKARKKEIELLASLIPDAGAKWRG